MCKQFFFFLILNIIILYLIFEYSIHFFQILLNNLNGLVSMIIKNNFNNRFFKNYDKIAKTFIAEHVIVLRRLNICKTIIEF